MVDEVNVNVKFKFNKDVPLKDWQIEKFIKEACQKLNGTQFSSRFLRLYGLDPNIVITDIIVKRKRRRKKKL